MEQVQDKLQYFNPILLDEMDSVRLMNRVDTKYLMHTNQLPLILDIVKPDYRVVEIAAERIKGYESLYFDTAEHEMYIKHHNRKLNRYKVRIRQYLDSQEYFLEVKFKKKRISVEGYEALQNVEANDFLGLVSPYIASMIRPKLFTTFDRITLVNEETRERVTLDMNLRLHNEIKSVLIPYLVIVEVKREFVSNTDGFGRVLRDQRVFPKRISKYCTATNLLYPDLKFNRFKPKIMYLRNLDNTKQYDRLYSAII